MFFKKKYNEIITLRNECCSLGTDIVIRIGNDLFKYTEDSTEFEYLKPFFIAFTGRIHCYMKHSLNTFSKKKINDNIFALKAELNHWRCIVTELEQRVIVKNYLSMNGNACVENLKSNIQKI